MKGFDDYKQHGFTLVELLIAMFISGIVMASIYSAFQSQQDSYLAQDQVAEMQQNIRAGLEIMTQEIRIAGYDPEGTAYPDPNHPVLGLITVATSGRFGFTQDFNEDGKIDITDTNEDIAFGFSSSVDADEDGVVDLGAAASLGRDTGGGFQPIAENIEAIEFYYTLDDGTQTTAPTAAQLVEIRNVQISILARAGNADRNFVNTATYTTASGTMWNPADDNFRRRLLITTVQCRNMGL